MRKLRVLIIENELRAAAGLKVRVESLGHQVAGLASDGWEGVRAVLDLDPDLIIVDIRLPLMDGLDVARTVLTYKPIPIILLTAYAAAEVVRRAREAGVMAYLDKPVDGRRLRSTIDLALARFGELQAICRETGDLKEALETRKWVERAKGPLIRWLRLPEAEAFQWMRRHSQGTGTGLKEVASAILNADDLLFRKGHVTRRLPAILDAVRRGLSPGHRPLPSRSIGEEKVRPLSRV